jgi:endonuclease III
MSATNRAQRLVKLVATLKKRYKVTLPTERPLFESLLYATMLENSNHEGAARSIAHLESNYFDWNEVRVSTRTELAEALKPLNDPVEAADRLKRTLQSVFESTYAFDLEGLKKQNLGVSVKQIAGYDGVTPFAVAYVTQNGLGGHAIATNGGLLTALLAFDIISEAEHAKQVVPGLERAIPKNKGAEAFALLHQLGVEIGKSPYGPTAKKLLLEIDPACKDRLPKKPAPPIEAPPAPAPVEAKGSTKADASAKKPAAPVPAAKAKEPVAAKDAPAAKATPPTKPAPAPKAAVAKPEPARKPEPAKKPAPQPTIAKKPEPAKKSEPAKAAPTKPDAKTTDSKKPEVKKTDSKKPANKQPDAKKGAVKKPDAKKPSAKAPEAKKPATKQPAAASAKPVAKKPVASKKPTPAKKPATAPPKRKPR